MNYAALAVPFYKQWVRAVVYLLCNSLGSGCQYAVAVLKAQSAEQEVTRL